MLEEEILTKRRAKRILSYSSSDDECITLTKSSHTIPTTIKSTVSEDKVTVLSDIRVNYNEKKLKALLSGSKRYNISSCIISDDFKDLSNEVSNNDQKDNIQEPCTSGSVQFKQKKRSNFFIHLSDTDDDSL